jgi:hypothetical protein
MAKNKGQWASVAAAVAIICVIAGLIFGSQYALKETSQAQQNPKVPDSKGYFLKMVKWPVAG